MLVFLHGGGDDPAARSSTFGHIARACLSGERGPLLLVAADQSPKEATETAEYYRALFAALGVPDDRIVPLILDPERRLTGAEVAAYEPAGLFVCGGVTPIYHQALCEDLSWVDYVREHTVFYAGTSAGAAVAADRAILGGWQVGDEARPILFQGASEGLEALTVRPGAGLVPFAVDVHAAQVGTLTRVVHAVRAGLVGEGWAIDEDTLLVVGPTGIAVHGQGFAYRVAKAGEGQVTVSVLAAPVVAEAG